METIRSLFGVSDFLNLLLIIVTWFTVRYASKTLLMEYSSQIYISRYRRKITSKDESWEVDVRNKGRGYVPKVFILLSIKSRKRIFLKQYHLSKPTVDIAPGKGDVIKLVLKESDIRKFDLDPDRVRLEVYYQDALNNIYVVSPEEHNSNKRLLGFEKLPKRIIFPFLYKYKFWKARKQKNTYVDRKNAKIKQRNIEAAKTLELILKNNDTK